MGCVESITERRSEQRYNLDDGNYAFFPPPVNKFGKIIDISLSGLSFRYFSINDEDWDSDNIDLVFEDGSCLENLPCEIIDDFIIPREQIFSQTSIRRSCIKFGELSREHVYSLQSLIDKYRKSNGGASE